VSYIPFKQTANQSAKFLDTQPANPL